MGKNCSRDQEKLLKLKAELRPSFKKIEITRTIHFNSDMSEQFLKQNAFIAYPWLEIFRSSTIKQL